MFPCLRPQETFVAEEKFASQETKIYFASSENLSSFAEGRLKTPYQGRDTLGDRSQRQVSATSRSVRTTCKTSRCDTTPVQCTRSDLE